MRRYARIVSIVLTAVLTITSMTGCSGKKENTAVQNSDTNSNVPEYLNLTGMPIAKKPITLKAFVTGSASMVDFNEMLVWQEYEKLTGIKIDWNVATQNAAEKRNLLLASNDLPDMFFKGSIPVQDIISYGEQGTFIKLNPLIDKYGPNFKAALAKYNEVRKGLTMPDGNIYSMPYIDDLDATTLTSKLYINQKWLDRTGMKMPTTIDEYYEVLKNFKSKDPNENGKNDEIPLSAPYGMDSTINQFGGSFGIINRGIRNSDLDADPKTGDLRYIPTAPEYREMLQFFNKLYTEGLLDKEAFTIKTAQFTAKSEQGIIGSGNSTSTVQFGTKYEKDYTGVPTILKGPQGYQQQSAVTSSLRTTGAFVITSANKYPEATMRWIDYFYGEDGLKLFFLGVEGKTFKNVNGIYEYVDEIAKNPKGMTLDQAAGQYLCWGGGNNPSIVTEKYFKGGATQPETVALVAGLKKYAPKEVWPEFVYTKQENEKLIGLRDDIRNYVNDMKAQFITGKAPLSQWDSYVKQLQSIGLEDYMKINKAAYDRYKNVK